MRNIKNKKAFTIVEIIISVTILIILSTIWFMSYENTLSDARNSTRISDMGNIKMSLKNHKFKNWGYPLPWASFTVTNSWPIIKQWLLNNYVITQEIIKKPTDPFVDWQFYFYSITNNKLFFQIAMSLEDETLENDYMMRAYVDWDYQQINDMVPSIVFATNSSWTIESLSSSFIVDKWTLNLPYDENWDIVKTALDFSSTILESWVSIPKFYWYYSCLEIYENWNFMWSWTYKMLDSSWNLTSSWCSMNY